MATDKGIVFRRYSSDVVVTVTLEQIFFGVVSAKLPSHLRFVAVSGTVPANEGPFPAAAKPAGH